MGRLATSGVASCHNRGIATSCDVVNLRVRLGLALASLDIEANRFSLVVHTVRHCLRERAIP